MDETKCIDTRQDHYQLIVKGHNLGEFELSELRNLIGIIDNAITITLK